MGEAATLDLMAQRRAAIAAAIRFLKSKCVLVEPVDKQALVRRYRVSGLDTPIYAEGVVAYARSLGMEAIHG